METTGRIFKSDGRAFVLAIDHPLTMPSPQTEDIRTIIKTGVENGVDAFLASYGCIRRFRELFADCPVILRCDGGTTFLDRSIPLSLLYDAEDAVRIGADAVMCMGFPGSRINASSLANVSSLVRSAHSKGLAAGAEMLPYGFEKIEGTDTRSVENVSFACRLGAEMGADFIKTEFVGGERFREVVNNCFVPVMVLGGAGVRTDEESLSFVRSAVSFGASGVIMGRSITSSGNMASLCRQTARTIHTTQVK